MNRYSFLLFLPFLLAIISGLTLTPMAFSASLLTDTELDALGAGGGSGEPREEELHDARLSDLDLDSITAQGLSGTIWPFQYLPDRTPVFRGFLTFPGKEEGSTVTIFRGLQFRETIPNIRPPQR